MKTALAAAGPRTRRLIALAAGAALPLAFAPFFLWWLAPPLLALLFLLWLDATPRAAAGLGFAFGFGAFATGTWWLYISIHVVGGAPVVMAVAAVLLLISLMAGYSALCGWLMARIMRWRPPAARHQQSDPDPQDSRAATAPGHAHARPEGSAQPGQAQLAAFCLLLLPGLWVLVEWLRGWLFTGFPWLTIGYTQVDGPLRGLAPVTGVYGLSLLVALLAGALALLVAGDLRRRLLALAVIVMAAGATLPLTGREWTGPAGAPLAVALVQGNVSQERKWRPEELTATMDLYRERTLALTGVDLVVWPEAAIPALAHEVEDYLDEMTGLGLERGFSLVTGILVYDFLRREFSNSLLSLGAQPGIYDKQHLVPFGEYFPVPGFVRNVLRLLDLPYQDITPGQPGQPPLMAGAVPLAPSICYEGILGNLQRQFFPEAQLLVNVSNDGWFGDSIAPHQHLQMARTRALESGRWLLRATNTGITALVDPDGRIAAQVPQFEVATLTGTVQPRTGQTPYLRLGDWPALLAALLLSCLGAVASRIAVGAASAANTPGSIRG